MTFIASVVSKDGVAIIADSLVTRMKYVIDLKKFYDFVGNRDSNTKIEIQQVENLFEFQPSHTIDYEEKLFQLDDYTVLTFAGTVKINDKRIDQIIDEYLDSSDSNNKSIQEKIEHFCKHLEGEVKKHLQVHSNIGETVFILTHFSKKNKQTEIYKVISPFASQNNLADENFQFVIPPTHPEPYKVVCEGQTKTSYMVLFGSLSYILQLVPTIAEKIKSDFKISDHLINDAYKRTLTKSLLSIDILNEFPINQLTNLSLQQAVDLAKLLMKLEMDFQQYTKHIPTVGGVIKIATIDKNGVKFITGHEINTSNIF